MNRRNFFSKIRQVVCAVALAPQIAFGTTKPRFEPQGIDINELFYLLYKIKEKRKKEGTYMKFEISFADCRKSYLSKEQLEILFPKEKP